VYLERKQPGDSKVVAVGVVVVVAVRFDVVVVAAQSVRSEYGNGRGRQDGDAGRG